jgi:hypothetical protein
MAKTFYDTATGRGLGTSTSDSAGMTEDDNTASVDGIQCCDTNYFPGGVTTARAAINYTVDKPVITASGGEFATVGNLPANCLVQFGVAEYTADASGSFTFDALSIGVFTFVINQVDYLRTTITIEAI